jgi:hypothetical protein
VPRRVLPTAGRRGPSNSKLWCDSRRQLALLLCHNFIRGISQRRNVALAAIPGSDIQTPFPGVTSAESFARHIAAANLDAHQRSKKVTQLTSRASGATVIIGMPDEAEVDAHLEPLGISGRKERELCQKIGCQDGGLRFLYDTVRKARQLAAGMNDAPSSPTNGQPATRPSNLPQRTGRKPGARSAPARRV